MRKAYRLRLKRSMGLIGGTCSRLSNMIKVVVGERVAKTSKGSSPDASEAFREELKWQDISLDELMTLASTPALFGLPADGRGQGGGQTFLLVGALNSERQDEFLDAARALRE